MNKLITVDNYKIIDKVQVGDKINFENAGLSYIVQRRYLSNSTRPGFNEEIFSKLGCESHRSKLEFCKRCYGYEPKDGCCPECYLDDMEALHRLIVAIFDQLIEKGIIRKPKTQTISQSQTKITVSNDKSFKPKIVL